MPTYEYQCQKCGAVMDVFQSIKARPLSKAKCEDCGAIRPVRRLIGTGGAILFKGSGFYITDYRSKGYQEKAKAESDGGAKAKDGGAEAKKGEKSADAKPAAESKKTADAKSGSKKQSD